MMSDPISILNILVGLGIVASVWRLNSTVATLVAEMRSVRATAQDHEERLRKGGL